jgi:putative ABC transport system ATP-binding protein
MTTTEQETLIQLESVAKVFYTDEMETHALADVHLTIRRGEYVSIEGPSGSGKTTLLSILGLLDTPTRGQYLLGGQPAANLTGRQRALLRNRQIGFIFQSFNLIGDLTVFENVELPLTYRGLPSAERKKRVEAALERVGMSHRGKHMPAQLSGGQQQRVAVARAVAGDPLVLLADEPTGNLDTATGNEIMGLFERLFQQGNTIVLVTHEHDIAMHAHRIIHIRDGKVEKDERIK